MPVLCLQALKEGVCVCMCVLMSQLWANCYLCFMKEGRNELLSNKQGTEWVKEENLSLQCAQLPYWEADVSNP